MADEDKTPDRDRVPAESAEEGYRVGYQCPPKHTQFKPKQSGNPKGRPRRTPRLKEEFMKVWGEKVQIREGTRVVRMSNVEAFVRAAVRRAINGDTKAIRAILLLSQIDEATAQGNNDSETSQSAHDKAILADFITRNKETANEKAADEGDNATESAEAVRSAPKEP